MHFQHPHPDKDKATPEQAEGFDTFLRWTGIATEENLSSPIWVSVFLQTAMDNAEREEAAAQRASIMAWAKWIHEGPAAGLRRQHKSSRVSDGWVPTERVSGKICDVDPNDHINFEEGLSA